VKAVPGGCILPQSACIHGSGTRPTRVWWNIGNISWLCRSVPTSTAPALWRASGLALKVCAPRTLTRLAELIWKMSYLRRTA